MRCVCCLAGLLPRPTLVRDETPVAQLKPQPFVPGHTVLPGVLLQFQGTGYPEQTALLDAGLLEPAHHITPGPDLVILGPGPLSVPDAFPKGKACKNMHMVYLLRSGEFMPLQISLPPTSIRPFNEFVSRAFLLRRRGICSAVVQLGLKKMNNGKDDYSVTTFKLLRDFEGEELRQIRDYADQFKEQVKVMLAQRAEQADAASGDVVEVGTTSRRLPDNEDHFAIGGVIDGEREELPA